MTGDVQTQGLLLLSARQAEGPLRAVRFLAAPWQQPANHRPIVAPSVPSRVVDLQHSTLVNEVNAKVGGGSLVRVEIPRREDNKRGRLILILPFIAHRERIWK